MREVSTRSVDELVKAMDLSEFSKSPAEPGTHESYTTPRGTIQSQRSGNCLCYETPPYLTQRLFERTDYTSLQSGREVVIAPRFPV